MSAMSEGTLLGGRVIYRQFRTGHRSGFEPVLLAASIQARPGEQVLEAGTGAGAGLLCLAARLPGIVGTGIEIDAALTRLANENFKINSFIDFFALQGDVAKLPFGAVFDHVFGNPPWHAEAGSASPDAARALAHQAPPGLLKTWITALAGVLKPSGSLTLILPAASFSHAAAALAAAGLPAITLFPLWPRATQAAGQVILQARRRGVSRVVPGLILHEGSGLTEAAEAVLRHAAALAL